jgi:hypothetical protein
VLATNGTLILVGASAEETKKKAGSRHIAHILGSFTHSNNQELGYALAERLPAYIADGSVKVSFMYAS